MNEQMTELIVEKDDEKETGRLEAFSDGVFAVAITLLVLDIKLPTIDPTRPLINKEIWRLIFDQMPNFGAFVISFFTIGIMWLNHHKIFKQIRQVDTGLILLNTLLLMIIVFIPVPTALLAPYLFNFDPALNAAGILYSVTFLSMALCFNVLWRYAAHHGRLLGKNANMDEVKGINEQYLFGPLLYILAVILAFFSTPLSALFQFLLAIFFAFPGRPKRTAGGQAVQPEKSEG